MYKPSLTEVPQTPREQYMELRAARTGLVLDQIAIYVSTAEEERMAKAAWGLTDAEWSEDYVIGRAVVHGEDVPRSRARLLFNYDLGIELEILQYLEGDNWHAHYQRSAPGDQFSGHFRDGPFISHIGFHVNDGPLPSLPFPLVQELWTEEHTNPHVAGRKYHYRIFDTRAVNGCFSKYIKRVS